MSEKKVIIIKKIKKGGHAHHGGAWKIAYADLVTALMAFFLLMWLLNTLSDETKEQLAVYFQEYSVFDGPPASLSIDPGGSPVSIQDQITPPVLPEQPEVLHAEGKSQEEILREAMAKMIEEKLAAYKEELMIDVFESGVRIQMLESQGKPFFGSGSAHPTDDARQVLKVIADTVRDMPQLLAVEGHTDSKPLGGKNSRYTNWELSTDRASSARLVLEEFGIASKRMVRVAGYADTQPLIVENSEDPRNRRVSILLFNPPEEHKNHTPPKALEVTPLPSGSEGLILPSY
ncbi:MAG: flagellar motor protein MotB [Desulfomicrobium sp.]|jgi:chemotaxis protein MotB|nr:flagellar motor protein MotB [Desulfomicrobium sp.]NLV97721.1 OmpA family protein [Desulfovibrionales bacterium]